MAPLESETGFKVNYVGGEICNKEKGLQHSTSIEYVCDPTVEIGKPVLTKSAFANNDTSDCHYIFQWRSKLACPQCKQEQVRTIQSVCQQGYRTIATEVRKDLDMKC